jgi:hypothetical protein
MLLVISRWTIHAAATLRCAAPSPSAPGWAVPHTHLSCGPGRAGWLVTRWLARATPTPGPSPHRATRHPAPGHGIVSLAEALETLRYAAPVSATAPRADGRRRLPEQECDVNFLASDSPKSPIGIDNK